MGRPTGKVDRVVVAGPLAPFAEGFQARLEELGYTPLSTVTWMRLMVHLSRWLGARGLTAADLSSQRVDPSTGGRPKARRMLTETNPTQDHLAEIFDLHRWAPRT